MLSGELIPSGRPSPDLLAVQRLANQFVEAHTEMQAKISALNTVTTEQLHDITRLKQELSMVCTGQKNFSSLNNNQVSGSTNHNQLVIRSANRNKFIK